MSDAYTTAHKTAGRAASKFNAHWQRVSHHRNRGQRDPDALPDINRHLSPYVKKALKKIPPGVARNASYTIRADHPNSDQLYNRLVIAGVPPECIHEVGEYDYYETKFFNERPRMPNLTGHESDLYEISPGEVVVVMANHRRNGNENTLEGRAFICHQGKGMQDGFSIQGEWWDQRENARTLFGKTISTDSHGGVINRYTIDEDATGDFRMLYGFDPDPLTSDDQISTVELYRPPTTEEETPMAAKKSASGSLTTLDTRAIADGEVVMVKQATLKDARTGKRTDALFLLFRCDEADEGQKEIDGKWLDQRDGGDDEEYWDKIKRTDIDLKATAAIREMNVPGIPVRKEPKGMPLSALAADGSADKARGAVPADDPSRTPKKATVAKQSRTTKRLVEAQEKHSTPEPVGANNAVGKLMGATSKRIAKAARAPISKSDAARKPAGNLAEGRRVIDAAAAKIDKSSRSRAASPTGPRRASQPGRASRTPRKTGRK